MIKDAIRIDYNIHADLDKIIYIYEEKISHNEFMIKEKDLSEREEKDFKDEITQLKENIKRLQELLDTMN